jgi:uncharacterized membrane protein required for colicin V production
LCHIMGYAILISNLTLKVRRWLMNLLAVVLDVVLLFGLVGGVLFGMQRGLVRTLLSTLLLFLASLFAAILYTPVISIFTSGVGNVDSARVGGSVVFFLLLVVFYAVLEYTLHRNYPDLRLKALKNWDNILGAVAGIAWALLLISLLLLIVDFAAQMMGGPLQTAGLALRDSSLVPLFRQFFKLPLAGIRLLFPQGLPEVLAYFTI